MPTVDNAATALTPCKTRVQVRWPHRTRAHRVYVTVRPSLTSRHHARSSGERTRAKTCSLTVGSRDATAMLLSRCRQFVRSGFFDLRPSATARGTRHCKPLTRIVAYSLSAVWASPRWRVIVPQQAYCGRCSFVARLLLVFVRLLVATFWPSRMCVAPLRMFNVGVGRLAIETRCPAACCALICR